MRKTILVRLLLLWTASFGATTVATPQQNVALCPEKPRLVLLILLDNLNNQQLEIVRNSCGAKGFNRLCAYGTQLTDAYFDAGGNFAGKNLATLYTGAPAATHGIVARQWVDSFSAKRVDAIYGTDIDSNGRADTLAKPHNGALLCGTIGNEIRKLYNDKAKVFSIGFDPLMLIWSSGTKQGEPFAWFDAKTGKVLTANVVSEQTTGWIEEYNSKNMPDKYLGKFWGPRKDIAEYHQTKYFPESEKGHSFYHQLTGSGRDKYAGVLGSPYANTLMRDLAAAAIIYEEMGKDDIPDVLTVQFTATPASGEKKQPLDCETEDMLLGLDENIASLLQMIDGTVGMNNTLVVFTSAQGAYDVANTVSPFWSEKGVVSLRRATALLNLYLMAKHGQAAWVKAYSPGSVYLDSELAQKKGVSFDTLLKESAEFLVQVKGIGDAIVARNLSTIVTESPVIEAMRKNYHPKRSGDILVYLEPGWAEELDDGTTLTQLWAGEFVPLIFYGWKVPAATIYERRNMADVAPTICSFIRVGLPNGCSGHPIPIVDYKARSATGKQ